MKNVFATVNSWDLSLFLLGVFHTPLFTKVQSLIATCDAEVFAIICWIIAYVAISVIKGNSKKTK